MFMVDGYVGDVGEGDHEVEVLKVSLVIRTHFVHYTIVVGNRGTFSEKVEGTPRLASERPNARAFSFPAQCMHLLFRYFENTSLLLSLE